jgi:hypothetical protein
MQGALVHSVSSQQPLHPAEHAINPLEPNFAWEADSASPEHHQIVIDLTEQRSINGVMFIHHEPAIEDGEVIITIEYSNNASDWTQVWLTGLFLGETPNELDFIKLRYLWDTENLEVLTISAQYWRITFYGDEGPDYYPPTDLRISALWLFTANEIDQRGILPFNDQISFPTNTQLLPSGKQYVTGRSVNQSVIFSRSWFVTDAQRTILWQIISQCNGSFRPFVLLEFDISTEMTPRRLCRFNQSAITESLIDVGLTLLTAQLTEIPIVQVDARH